MRHDMHLYQFMCVVNWRVNLRDQLTLNLELENASFTVHGALIVVCCDKHNYNECLVNNRLYADSSMHDTLLHARD